MPNQLYQQINNNQGGLLGMVQKFNEFRQNFQGDPQQMVQQLLNSGRMTQQDYNRLSQMATEFQKLLSKRF